MNAIKTLYKILLFRIERFIIRGALFQLLSIAFVILFITLTAAILAYNAPSSNFSTFSSSLWWAFLRLTDPGYLGDDQGLYIRFISTTLTILGYVLFLGSLVAILTQGLNRFLSKLESGLTDLNEKNHIIILNLTHKTPLIVKELLLSKSRVSRFLKKIKSRKLRIVVLSETVNVEILHNLRAELGSLWDESKVIMRSGSPLEIEHLKRVNFLDAAAVIYPASDLKEDRIHHDSKVFKILFTCSSYAEQKGKNPPQFITEIHDNSNLDLIEETGIAQVDALASNSIICRLIVQNIRHRFLSYVYNELLNYGEGNQISIRLCNEFIGLTIAHLSLSFPKAILLGIYRNNEAILNPSPDFTIQENDKAIFMATSFQDTFTFIPDKFENREVPNSSLENISNKKERNILILGWSYKCVDILDEFNSYSNESFSIDILSAIPTVERQHQIKSKFKILKHTTINHIEADYTTIPLHQIVDLKSYTNILLVANDWLDTDEQVDARTLHGHLRLLSSLRQINYQSDILVELMNGENEKTFPKKSGEILVSPVIISHILAHMTLKPELNEVFDEMFGPLGSEIKFIPALDFTKKERINFYEIQKLALHQGSIALGIVKINNNSKTLSPNVHLNPDRRIFFEFTNQDKIILLVSS